jgi:hypothetical protein
MGKFCAYHSNRVRLWLVAHSGGSERFAVDRALALGRIGEHDVLAYVHARPLNQAAMFARASGRVGVDAEHRVVRGDPRELSQRGPAVYRDVRPGSGRDLQVAAQDRGEGGRCRC